MALQMKVPLLELGAWGSSRQKMGPPLDRL